MAILKLTLTREEYEWLRHAADLDGVSLRAFIHRAVNQRLMKLGIDAVLLPEGEEA